MHLAKIGPRYIPSFKYKDGIKDELLNETWLETYTSFGTFSFHSTALNNRVKLTLFDEFLCLHVPVLYNVFAFKKSCKFYFAGNLPTPTWRRRT